MNKVCNKTVWPQDKDVWPQNWKGSYWRSLEGPRPERSRLSRECGTMWNLRAFSEGIFLELHVPWVIHFFLVLADKYNRWFHILQEWQKHSFPWHLVIVLSLTCSRMSLRWSGCQFIPLENDEMESVVHLQHSLSVFCYFEQLVVKASSYNAHCWLSKTKCFISPLVTLRWGASREAKSKVQWGYRLVVWCCHHHAVTGPTIGVILLLEISRLTIPV